MKTVKFFLILIFSLGFISCGDYNIDIYYKSFFIAEDTFIINGEVFINSALTAKANFDKITVKVESVAGWEITGIKTTDNKFTLTVNKTANDITLSNDTINPDLEPELSFLSEYIYGFNMDFSYHVLVFNIDNRRALGAIEPEFGNLYYYVYIPEPVDASGEYFFTTEGKFGLTHWSIYSDMDFYRPGWYKIYYSQNKPIGDKPAYSNGNNTRIRTPQ